MYRPPSTLEECSHPNLTAVAAQNFDIPWCIVHYHGWLDDLWKSWDAPSHPDLVPVPVPQGLGTRPRLRDGECSWMWVDPRLMGLPLKCQQCLCKLPCRWKWKELHDFEIKWSTAIVNRMLCSVSQILTQICPSRLAPAWYKSLCTTDLELAMPLSLLQYTQ